VKITVSSLADIPGLGPARRTALEKAGVADLEGLLAMKVAELAAVQGIGMWQARKIREFLRQAGLLVEAAGANGEPVAVLRPPKTPAEAEVISETAGILEAQAAVQSRLETEIEALSEAVAEAQEEAAAEGEDASGQPAQAYDFGSSRDDMAAAPKPSTDSASWREQVRAQREQLPESALSLMEAIRQAAVSQQLTRQITRLLIIAGEFLDDGRDFPPETQERVQAVLARAERMMHEAIEAHAFSPTDQKDLARRLRRRRKELEALLGGVHVDGDDS
jgi:hypothetical protein